MSTATASISKMELKKGVTLEEEARSFRENCIRELTHQILLYQQDPALDTISCWEAHQAIREMFKQQLPPALPMDSEDIYWFGELTERLAREVYVYKLFRDKIAASNLRFNRGIDLLSAAVATLSKKKDSEPTVAQVENQINHCMSVLQDSLATLKKWKDEYWPGELLAASLIRFSPTTKPRNTAQMRREGYYKSTPLSFNDLSEMYGDIDEKPQLTKGTDLDSRFQVRVATIFRDYYRVLSLRTISRLIVLTYKAGELGRETDDGRLILDGVSRSITVASVDKKIRAAGIK